MDESFFLKKTDVARFVERLFHLTTIEEQSKDWVNINPEYFSKSYKYVFNCLMISLGSKSAFNWSNTLHFFKNVKAWELKKIARGSIMPWLKAVRILAAPFLYLFLLLFLTVFDWENIFSFLYFLRKYFKTFLCRFI